MINPFTAIAHANAYVNKQKKLEIQTLSDTVRCTLVAQKLEDIPQLLKSLITEIGKEKAQYCVKNQWKNRCKDNIQHGYVGLHVKILLKVPGDSERFVVTEVQIHHDALMNGMKDCAKELAHRIYKPDNEQGTSRAAIDCSRLIFLSAMAIALSSQQRQKEVEETLDKMEKDQNTLSPTKIPRVILRTVHLLNYPDAKPHKPLILNPCGGKFIDAYQAVQPDNGEEIISAWLKAVEEVNKILEKSGLPQAFKDASDPEHIRNTATTIDELFSDAQKVVMDFGGICRAAIEGAQRERPTAVYSKTTGPLGETLKADHSLRNKVEDQLKEKIKDQGPLIRFVAATKDHRNQKTAKHISLASVLILAGVGMQRSYSSLQSTSAIFDTFKEGFQNTNNLFHNSVNNLTNDSLTFLQNRFSFKNLSLDNPNNATDTVNSLTGQVIACNLELYEQIKAKNESMNEASVAKQNASEIQQRYDNAIDTLKSLTDKFNTCNSSLSTQSEASNKFMSETSVAKQNASEIQQRYTSEIDLIRNCFGDINTALHSGFVELSAEEQDRLKAKQLLANITVDNTQKSCFAITNSLTALFDSTREYSVCLKQKEEYERLASQASNKTIEALNQTITNLEKHHNETVPLLELKGKCEDYDDIKKQRDHFQNESVKNLIEIAYKNGNLTLCEKDNSTNKNNWDKSEDKLNTCETALKKAGCYLF